VMNLNLLSEEVGDWAFKNFGRQTPASQALKVCEEAGELGGATLKGSQGIRKHENHNRLAQDAVGDIVIALACYCHLRGWNFDHLVHDTWSKVRQRDWKADPERAHLR